MDKRITIIGLGKMGYNLALNFKNKGHNVVAFDVNKTAMEKIIGEKQYRNSNQ